MNRFGFRARARMAWLGRVLTLAFVAVCVTSAVAAELKPIVLHPDYEHDKWGTQPKEYTKQFRAYTVSFDSADDDDGDDQPDVWGIPQWVAYEIKAFEGELGPGPSRPDWMIDEMLVDLKLAPEDDSYHFSREWRKENPDHPLLGYDRGHMCPKYTAFRLGADADWNTHTFLNACPQRSELNQGIWNDLEQKCRQWADHYGRIWVITGPVLYERKPRQRLGQEELDEFLVAIPDAFFKIVIRESDEENGELETLAFLYPQRGYRYREQPHNHQPFLTNIDAIEYFTGLDFLTELEDDVEERVEIRTATALWEVN